MKARSDITVRVTALICVSDAETHAADQIQHCSGADGGEAHVLAVDDVENFGRCRAGADLKRPLKQQSNVNTSVLRLEPHRLHVNHKIYSSLSRLV